MPINNAVYQTQAGGWWDENHYLHLLKTGINPARFGYFVQVLTRQLNLHLPGLRVLDVGCGGGILSESFAEAGCQVSGIDPASASLKTARTHAAQSGLKIHYQQASGEAIPFPSNHFDIVTCCDVLEHVNDLSQVLRELARVAKPGAPLFFDTINRSPKAFVANIFIAQQFPLTRFFDPNVHIWEKFITPSELHSLLEANHLRPMHFAGLGSSLPDLQVAALLVWRKMGRLSMGELGRRLQFRVGGGSENNYIGWAQKEKFPTTGLS